MKRFGFLARLKPGFLNSLKVGNTMLNEQSEIKGVSLGIQVNKAFTLQLAEQAIPYWLRDALRCLWPSAQQEIADAIEAEMLARGGGLTSEEVVECATKVLFTSPNTTFEDRCMEAFRGGRSLPLETVMDSLRKFSKTLPKVCP